MHREAKGALVTLECALVTLNSDMMPHSCSHQCTQLEVLRMPCTPKPHTKAPADECSRALYTEMWFGAFCREMVRTCGEEVEKLLERLARSTK